MKKKFLALVMTLSMVLSLVPMTALAAGGDSTGQPTTTAEGQPASEGANEGKQDSDSNADGGNTPTGDEGSTDTSKDSGANTENKNENTSSGSGNTDGTTTGDSSTSGTGSTEGGGIPSSGGTTTEGGESTTTPEPSNKVAKNIDTHAEYETLDAAIAEAGNGATIEVLADCTTAGLELRKDLTIQGAESLESKPTITFTDKGIALWGKLIFKDCNVVMNGIGSTPYTAEWSWMTVSAGKDALLSLDGATMTMDGTGTASGVHAIYFGSNNKLNLSNGSELKIKNYNQDALEWDDGDGGYNVNIKDSTFISDHNRSAFTGTFYATIDNSTVKVINSTGNGSNGTYYTIQNDSNVTFNSNGGWGISAWRIDMTNGSTLTAMDNGYSGVWTRVLNVDRTCTLDVEQNGTKATTSAQNAGIVFQGNGTYPSKIEEGANVTIKDNAGSGIYTKQKVCNLTIESATITNNGLGTVNASKIGADKGGGIYNVGTMTLGKNVVIYNNHAQNAGDDICNSTTTDKKGITYTGTVIFSPVGNGWVLDDCNHAINGWYDDSVGNRWNAHDTEKLHIVEFDPTAMNFKDISTIESGTEKTEKEVAPLALKAAHPLLYKVSYVMSGEIPEKYKNKGPEQKFYAANSQYTIADTFPSVSGVNDNGVNGTFSFSGWSFTQGGTPVSGKQTLTKDVTLYGVWTFTKKNSGHRPSNPPVTIPDDVPTGLDLKNHYGYIIGYPVDYYTGKPTTDQTKKPVRPEGKITRAEVATIYFRMLTDENRAANWNQVSGFSDVKSSAWYNNAISTLTKAGILKGYEDGTFQPNGYITRAEFATIAIRFFSGVYEGEDLFPDIKGHWAEDYINNAANKGLVKGYEDGTFGPDRYITRAEAVTLVNRTLNRHPHNDGLHKDMLVWPDNMDTSKWYYADMQEATNSHEPDKNKTTADKEYWGKMLPIRDWEALEKEWSNANSAPGEGEVV